MATSEPASANGRNVLVNENTLTSIADAIRNKNKSTDRYKPSQMADAINAIQTGGSELVDNKEDKQCLEQQRI